MFLAKFFSMYVAWSLFLEKFGPGLRSPNVLTPNILEKTAKIRLDRGHNLSALRWPHSPKPLAKAVRFKDKVEGGIFISSRKIRTCDGRVGDATAASVLSSPSQQSRSSRLKTFYGVRCLLFLIRNFYQRRNELNKQRFLLAFEASKKMLNGKKFYNLVSFYCSLAGSDGYNVVL